MQHVLCEGAKKVLAQARPHGACSTSFGFPSNHSSFAASLATWLLLEEFFFEQHAPFKSWKYYRPLRNSFLFFVPFIIISRHHLNYHSPAQILAGMMIGFTCASAVFAVMYYTIVSRSDYSSLPFAKIWTLLKFRDNLIHKQKLAEEPNQKAKSQ
jgi:membrane-associated phospholipid phosphatase